MTKKQGKGIAVLLITIAACIGLVLVLGPALRKSDPSQLSLATTAIQTDAQKKLTSSGVEITAATCRYLDLATNQASDVGPVADPTYVCTLKLAAQGQTACLGVIAKYPDGGKVTVIEGRELAASYCA